MTKITLTDLANLQNETTAVATINANNAALTTAINSSLWRVGGVPNEMDVDFDMNSNRILNLPQAVFDQEPVRLEEFNRALFDATTVVLSYGLSNGLNFDTRAAAQATQIPALITYITISKYATGFGRCDAPYVRGGTVIPFTDALGAQWGLDTTGGILSPYWFGCKQDGVTDDTSAFQTLMNNAAGKTILVQGIVGLSSAISVVSRVTIRGVSPIAGFTALGSNSFSVGLLFINNQNNVRIENLSFTGNVVEPVAFSTGAIFLGSDSGNSGLSANFYITGCFFTQFKTSAWIGIWQEANPSNTSRLTDIFITNNRVFAAGTCATTTGQSGSNGNTFVRATSNTLSTNPGQGDIGNVVFSGNNIQGLGLSGAFMGFSGIHNVTVSGNTTLNMGNNTLPTDTAYTYLFYNSTPSSISPRNISVVNNTGFGNHNNPVYFATVNNGVISGNTFKFTYTGGIEPTLPWGASIALNGVHNITVTGNTLTDSLGGIAAVSLGSATTVGVSSPDTLTISDNSISSANAETGVQVPYGIMLTGFTDTQDQLVNITGNTIKVTGDQACGIQINGGTNVFLGTVKISDNLIEANHSGIQQNGASIFQSLHITGNKIGGTLLNYAMDIQSASGPVFLSKNVCDFSQVVAGSSGGVRFTGPEYYIDGLTLYKKTNTGDAFSTSGITAGTLRNVNTPKSSATIASGSTMGAAIPTTSGTAGDVVQNLLPSETGSSSSKYIIDHWVCTGGTTWLPSRCLTGN